MTSRNRPSRAVPGARLGRKPVHGEAGTDRRKATAEYACWVSMRQRCRDRNAVGFHHYGGRGIRVCARWEKFENFLEDMGRRPSAKHSLDRIDNDAGYFAANCRWTTVEIQNRNQRGRNLVTIDGVTKLKSQWADEAGISRVLFWHRLSAGWDPKRALSVPPHGGRGHCRRGHPLEPGQKCRVCMKEYNRQHWLKMKAKHVS